MLTVVEIEKDIHPTQSIDWIWLVVGVALLGVAVGIWVVFSWWNRTQASRATRRAENQFKKEQLTYLSQLTQLATQLDENKITRPTAAQKTSSLLRSFLGIALDLDTDSANLAELERLAAQTPQLNESLQIIKSCYPVSFDSSTTVQVQNLINQAKGVIERWS